MKINFIEKLASNKLSLRYKVLSLFAIAIIFPALIFSTTITSIGKNNLKESIFYRQEEIVSRLADRINGQLELHLKLLSLRNDVNTLSPVQKKRFFLGILEKGSAFSEVLILDPKNREVYRFSKAAQGKRRNVPLQSLAFKNSVSKVFSPDNGKPYVYLKAPLRNKYSILARLDFSQLLTWVSEIKIGEFGMAFIVDEKGDLIAHREAERVLAGSNFANLPVVQDFMNNRESSPKRWREYFDERGKKVVALYKAIPRLGWAAVTQIPAEEVYQPISNMNKSIALWTLCWTAAFLFVGLGFAKKIVDPLILLRSGAEKISRGNLDIKLNIKTGDEIEEVARNFEKMAEDLKKLETMKDDLTKMVVHDLKSPLSGIMGGLDYLDSGLMGDLPDDQAGIVRLAKKSSENMLVLIQNILDIAKMEAGKLELKKEKVNIAELLTNKQKEFGAQAINEEKELSLAVANELPEVEIEKNIIERVINNLIGNAIKHTSSQGKIRLSAGKEKDFLKISVSDNGPGIPDGFKEKIFEKFVQIERDKSGLRAGAGLGLTFCKMAVEAHGGSIWVESELDNGSSFIFTLPIS